MMREFAVRAIRIAEPKPLLGPHHLRSRDAGSRQVEGAVTAQAGQPRRVGDGPIAGGDPAWHTRLGADFEARWVECGPNLVSTAAKPEPVVVALFKDAQFAQQGPCSSIGGDCPGCQSAGKPPPASDAAGRHTGDDRNRKVIIQVADRPRRGENEALGFSLDLGHECPATPNQDICGLFFCLVVFPQPTDLMEDTVGCVSVSPRIVVTDSHLPASIQRQRVDLARLHVHH